MQPRVRGDGSQAILDPDLLISESEVELLFISQGERIDRMSEKKCIVLCPECRVLMDAFIEAAHEIISLQERHILAVVENDLDPHRFDILIHAAIEKKLNAKYAYISHQEAHGGSLKNETNRS